MKLTARERQDLIKLEKQIPHKGIGIRIRIILALDDGYPEKDVARILLLDEGTVTRWKKKYQEGKLLSDWLDQDYKGYAGKLTQEQEIEVEKFIESRVITDCREVMGHIKDVYGVSYTVNGITKLLHRLGFTYKQVIGIPGKLSEEKQAAFVKAYQELKEKKRDDEVILFGDGVHPTHNLHKTRAWIKKGEEKQVKTNTGRGRLNIHGTMDPQTLDVTVHYSETINAQVTMEFFDELQIKYAHLSRIYLIVDNATYYKNKDVTSYLKKPGCKIKLIFLPSYSPNLNYIERLWKFMKKYIIGVKYREKFKEFEADINYFFTHIENYKDKLRLFIGTDLHLIKVTV